MKSYLFLITLLIYLSCNTITNKKAPSSDSPVEWIFNDQGVFINENGIALQGTNLIQNYLNANPIDLLASKIQYSVDANADTSIYYEIRSGKTKTNELYTILTVLKKDQAARKIDLMFLGKSNKTELPLDELNTRRTEWMSLCNQHHVDSLVKELYTPDALYFNHKPLIIGTADIIKEYGYMNQSNYHLTLTPLHVAPVSDSLIFEVGQGSGSYGGKYILVWKKTTRGKWMVYMDSNI